MASREVHVERLISRRVVDAGGRSVGRIEEIRVERKGDDLVVSEYLLGPAALLERLSASIMKLPLLRLLRRGRRASHVRWQDMDLGDPEHPRLRAGSAERKRR
jgi:hypothetical protein